MNNASGASRSNALDLRGSGATRTPDDGDLTAAELDRQKREQAVEAQLAYLKRKMGKGKT